MLKKILILLLAVVLLAGCQKDHTRQIDEEKYNAYLAYYQAILDYDNKKTSSDNFSIGVVANKISDTQYRYDVIVDNPRIAMYDIEILAIVENISATINTEVMMPSIGIFDAVKYNMIPYQVDITHNFVKGLDLSVLTADNPVHIGVMVSWKDKDSGNVSREYFSLAATYTEPVEDKN